MSVTDLTVLVEPKKRPIPIMVTLEREPDSGATTGPYKRYRPTEPHLLSPPPNTWKRPRHRPTRSQSAPPINRRKQEEDDDDNIPLAVLHHQVTSARASPVTSPVTSPVSSDPPYIPFPTAPPIFTFHTPQHHQNTRELRKPPPPLLRPTTFWRKTTKSGVTGSTYSPASHLIRRSTYVAAGLRFDNPIGDLSALCVESRVGVIVVPPDPDF